MHRPNFGHLERWEALKASAAPRRIMKKSRRLTGVAL